jgi:hypothetical protein
VKIFTHAILMLTCAIAAPAFVTVVVSRPSNGQTVSEDSGTRPLMGRNSNGLIEIIGMSLESGVPQKWDIPTSGQIALFKWGLPK